MKLDGIIVPLITPLTPEESLDERGLENIVEHVIIGGVSAIFVLGSSGEGPALSLGVKERLVRAVSAQAKGRVPVLVGAFGVGTHDTVALAKQLTRQGGDAIVVVAPYYFALSQDEIAAHVAAVARSQDVPTMVYNIPQAVKTIIEPETVARMAEIPEIIAVKDSLGDMTRFQRLLETRAVRPDWGVYQGAEGVAALSLVRGANGCVLGLANIAPQLCCDLFAAARGGNLPRAWALQERLMKLWQVHTHGQWLACLKTGVSQLGLCGATIAAPIEALEERAIAAIRCDMEAAGVLPQ